MMAGLRTGLKWSALLGAAAVAAVAVLLGFNPLGSLLDEPAAQAVAPRGQSEIALASLSRTVESEGELVFAQTRSIGSGSSGTFTSVAEVGSAVDASSVLFEIDGDPTVALIGPVPMWRTMAVGDVGQDVVQLETNLVALGYDPDGDLSVDDTYTTFTATLVERWQEDLGLSPTGTVSPAMVAFVPDGARITSVSAAPGQTATAAPDGSSTVVLTASAGDREVVFPVDTEELDGIGVGTEISARLPDRATVTGLVTGLNSAGDGSWTATATLTSTGETALSDDDVLPDGEAVPVSVSWTVVVAEDVPAIRANALTRLDSGGYALEVVEEDGSTRFVEVGLGAQAGSTVELISELEPGTAVITP